MVENNSMDEIQDPIILGQFFSGYVDMLINGYGIYSDDRRIYSASNKEVVILCSASNSGELAPEEPKATIFIYRSEEVEHYEVLPGGKINQREVSLVSSRFHKSPLEDPTRLQELNTLLKGFVDEAVAGNTHTLQGYED